MKPFPWDTKTVLVTGGAGFLGDHVVMELKNRGCKKVIAPTRAACDLRDSKGVKQLFESAQFQIVIHLAASVGGIGANQKRPADFFYDNELMGLHLLHEASKQKIEKFVQIGTVCAYPKFAPVPFREESLWDGYPEETNAPYGIAKRSLLVAAESFRQQYDLNYCAIFPTNLYGPKDDFELQTSHVIPALIRKCEDAKKQNQDSITLWGTGKPTRDFLYVTDAVNGILLSCERQEADGQMINLGSEQEVSIIDLAGLISRLTGFKGKWVWDSSKPDGQPRRCVSNEKARKLLGFEPKVSLETGLEQTIRWYREYGGS